MSEYIEILELCQMNIRIYLKISPQRKFWPQAKFHK
jgi:hypothetical protein